MLRFHFLTVLLFSILITASCKKDNNGDGSGTPSAMVIDITSPAPNATFFDGGNLKVEGTMTDNNLVQSARVEIRNKATSAVLYSASTPTPNVSFYRFLWNWMVSGVTTNFTATIKVTGRDSRGDEVIKEVDVNLVP